MLDRLLITNVNNHELWLAHKNVEIIAVGWIPYHMNPVGDRWDGTLAGM